MSTREPRPGATPNRLARSTSPYLLQHRHNPVDWWPWGDEAFAEARRRDVPIFLSVGYSTCYWCHVMERESFESEAIAAQMNREFVCVKVDREERPDVDDLYMAAVQAFTQRGGWPMSVFIEPGALRPFYAGTYFPAEARYAGMPSFPRVLSAMAEAWRGQRAECLQQAAELADAVRERVVHEAAPVRIGEAQVAQAVAQLVRLHDRTHGGFGGAPKFPQPAFLDLMLDTRAAAGDEGTRTGLDAALGHTLRAMALGGIFDQVGGGFHRYSVDARWLVPHFEKMLYDNGALLATYARAAKVHGDPLLARTARRTGEYVLREMTAPGGAFFSAQDAEVNHREGQNYLWTRAQLDAVLGADDGEWIAKVYGVDRGPNFQDPHHPGDPPSSVLHFAIDPEPILGDPAQLARLDGINARLYAARRERDQPGTDDKVLAAWNGLMIAGLSVAGAALAEPRFVEAARRAADFILAGMRGADGSLRRVHAGGVASVDAPLEDYAFLAHGLAALHGASPGGSPTHLDASIALADRAFELFGDGSGGLYDTLAGRSDLFVRARSVFDGAIPSGSSVMINALLDLALATGDRRHARRAAGLLASVSGYVAQGPLAAANATRGLLRLLALDRAALETALPAAGAPAPADDEFTPVEILAAVEGVEVGAAEPAGVILKVRVAEGYHVAAAEPGEGLVGVVPFRVHAVGGSGVSVYAAYPEGRELSGGPAVGSMRVYEGEFDLPVVLERSGDWKGDPLLAVTYQACTDDACLKPRTVELDLAIERA